MKVKQSRDEEQEFLGMKKKNINDFEDIAKQEGNSEKDADIEFLGLKISVTNNPYK